MRKSAIFYISLCIISAMGLLLILSIRDRQPLLEVIAGVAFLALLGVIAESQSLAIDDQKALSIAFAIDISALLLFGLAPAAWVSFCTAFFSVMDFGRGRKEHLFNTPPHKSLFNASNYILSILACGFVFIRLGGVTLQDAGTAGIEGTFLHLAKQLPQILAGVIVYVLVNTLMVVFYFLTAEAPRKGIFKEWTQIFQWSVLSMVCIGTLGVFLTGVYHAFGFLSVLLFFAPFMLFRYAFMGFTSIQKGYMDTIKAFSAALEAKDIYTVGHARRVEKYCELIAGEMKLPSGRIKSLKYASLLHDIGKIGISESILNKAGDLTDEEFDEIRRHPAIAAQMLGDIRFLKKEVGIIRGHHIRYDGGGYPADAVDEGSQLEAQILCAADSYDAMTSDRAYRAAMSRDEAIDELRRNAGSQFSPEVVQAFVSGLAKRAGNETGAPS